MLEKKDRPGLICKERERGGGGGGGGMLQTYKHLLVTICP